MYNFSCVISNDDEDLLFNFLKVFTTKGERYIVMTAVHSKVYSFYMKHENHNWIIDKPEKLPPRLLDLEGQLSNAIKQRIN